MKKNLILASSSPRRKLLLEQLGISFKIIPPFIDEVVLPGEAPEIHVTRLAQQKAQSIIKGNFRDKIVLAADTIVVSQGKILGKPCSKEHCVSTLKELSGSKHEVLTGVSIRGKNKTKTFYVRTEVTFRSISSKEIEWYWKTGEPLDKAGSYGLQGVGAAFVRTLTGSYTNVIGLPISETVLALRGFSVECLGEIGC